MKFNTTSTFGIGQAQDQDQDQDQGTGRKVIGEGQIGIFTITNTNLV